MESELLESVSCPLPCGAALDAVVDGGRTLKLLKVMLSSETGESRGRPSVRNPDQASCCSELGWLLPGGNGVKWCDAWPAVKSDCAGSVTSADREPSTVLELTLQLDVALTSSRPLSALTKPELRRGRGGERGSSESRPSELDRLATIAGGGT